MLFKVMTIGRTEAMIRKVESGEAPITKTIMIPPKTILDVYGYVKGEDFRFVVWNENISASFFTIGIVDCRPAQ